jgi:mannitol-specific phosphotransferase system IIBC component
MMMNMMIGILVVLGVAVMMIMMMRKMTAIRVRELESLSQKEKMQKISSKDSSEKTTTTTKKITDVHGVEYAKILGMIGMTETGNPHVEGVPRSVPVEDISTEERCKCHGLTYTEMRELLDKNTHERGETYGEYMVRMYNGG